MAEEEEQICMSRLLAADDIAYRCQLEEAVSITLFLFGFPPPSNSSILDCLTPWINVSNNIFFAP